MQFSLNSSTDTDPRKLCRDAAAMLQASLEVGSDDTVRLRVRFAMDLLNGLAANITDANPENDRLREAITWAVGFIRCNFPKASEQYPDMRNAESLIESRQLNSGEFHKVCAGKELAEQALRGINDILLGTGGLFLRNS